MENDPFWISFTWDPVRAEQVLREETAKRVTNQIALSLLQNKAPIKLIAECTRLSVKEVEKIAREHQLAIS